jgi:DNA-binding transcriptional regulator YdaS (Cro superfamily)
LKKLNQYLKKNKINIRQFAQRLEVNPTNVYFWSKGKTKPRVTEAIRMDRMTKGEVSVYSWE